MYARTRRTRTLSGVKRAVLVGAVVFSLYVHLERGDWLWEQNLLCGRHGLRGFLGHALLDVVHCDFLTELRVNKVEGLFSGEDR